MKFWILYPKLKHGNTSYIVWAHTRLIWRRLNLTGGTKNWWNTSKVVKYQLFMVIFMKLSRPQRDWLENSICQVYEAEFLCSNHQWDPMIELNAWYASLYLKNLPIYVEFLGNHFLPKFNVTAWLAHLDAKMDIFSGPLSGFICNHHLATRKHQNLWL